MVDLQHDHPAIAKDRLPPSAPPMPSATVATLVNERK